jgi:hypothetical protein
VVNRTVIRVRGIVSLLGLIAIALVLEAGKRWGD